MTLENNPITPTDTTNIQLSIGNEVVTGIYPIVFEGNSSGITYADTVVLNISNGIPDTVKLIGPIDGLIVSPLNPSFNWQPTIGKVKYEFEISENPDFNTITHSSSALDSSNITLNRILEGGQNYYWRVKAMNTCGFGAYSETGSFYTMEINCASYSAKDLPINISASGTPTITSSLFINEESIITDVNVVNIGGIHTYMSDLSFELISPKGTIIQLLVEKCGDQDEFNMNFDDQAVTDTIPCPPINGVVLRPKDRLSTLIGERSGGNWQLRIKDSQDLDGGELSSWGLRLCSAPLAFKLIAVPISSSEVAISWDDILNDEINYIVERTDTREGSFETVAALGADKGIFIDRNLQKNTSYFYRLKAEYSDGRFSYSNILETTTLPDIPYSPSDFAALEINQTSVRLNWNDNSDDEVGFIIRSYDNEEILFQVDSVPVNSSQFIIEELDANTAYKFEIVAFNLIGNSEPTSLLEITTLPFAPLMPRNFSGNVISFSTIRLEWESAPSNEEEYVVERKLKTDQSFSRIVTLNLDQTIFIDSELLPATAYQYRLKAQNIGGSSEYTDTLELTTLSAPPLAPSDLTGNISGTGTINLWWNDNSNTEEGFILERAQGSTENFLIVDSLVSNVTSYADENKNANIPYIYKIRAFNDGGNSPFSNFLSITIFPDPPLPPSNLRAFEVGQTNVSLTWNDNANNETGFIIEKSINTPDDFFVLDSIPSNQLIFDYDSLSPNKTYFFRIKAFNINGNSSYSEEVQVITLPTVPLPPSDLAIVSFNNNDLILNWQDNSVTETGFVIERSLENNLSYQIIATVTSDIANFFDFGVRLGETYFYRVAAQNGGGLSEYSNEVSTLTVGMLDDINSNISILPNPTFGQISVQANQLRLFSFKLFSYDGKLIQRFRVGKGNHHNVHQLDISNTPSGVYFLRIETENGVAVKKVVKN